MSKRRTFFLSPSPGIVTLQITTEHSDDQAFAPATKTKMADQCGMCTFCPSERDMDGKIHVSLDNDSVWQEFHSIGTEMLLTREGSRMIPFCRFRLTGLAPHRHYFLLMDFQLVNKSRAQGGLSDTHKVVSHIYTHPSSPATGLKWMRVPVTFNMVKLTSDLLNDPRIVMLKSDQRYVPRLHVVPFDPSRGRTVDLDDPETWMFMFPQTEFCAVSCYQNLQLINLKIKHNQFDHEEMHLGTYMQSPPGAAHESSASPSPDFNHTKNKCFLRAKKPYLPTAAQLGLEASPVLKKKMDSEPSSPDDSSVVTETPSGPGSRRQLG
ncbi:T-box protein VegT-B-like isoform X2 [Alosa sapidissima]|uniref:T-box protein VegT-B-like isoform X2 n=1 Tax=Alosa sapidissima TaxID=34773 RepID=UPI001C0934DE|nr:T-box protein VegT-B-like isoform X2 [Alosa sapidissima]